MKYLMENQYTDRLYFRLLERDDFDTWLKLFNNDSVARFIGMDKLKTPREQCEDWFQRIEYRYVNNLGGMNVLVNKSTNELIGQCGLLIQKIDGSNRMEIGYSILPRFWNQGYATEAAKKCRDFAFENSYSDDLISIIHVDNIISKKVAINNEMVFIRNSVFRGMPVDIFAIQKADWIIKR